MGIQSGRVTSEVPEMSKFPPFFLALTVCPYDGGSKTGGRFGYQIFTSSD